MPGTSIRTLVLRLNKEAVTKPLVLPIFPIRTVATYQTLISADRLQKFHPSRFKIVIVDEAHHSLAPSYLRILSHFNQGVTPPSTKSLARHESGSSCIPIVGFSATFNRHDGLALGKVYQEIVYHKDFLEMIRDKWLCDIVLTTVRTQIDLSQVTVNSRTGDFGTASLASVLNSDTINQLVFKTWLHRAGERRSTLVFCVNIQHVKDLTSVFRRNGVDARFISGNTPASERAELLTKFKTGDFPVLLNCAVLTEGADVPNIDCVVLARPTRSKIVFAQMIGRGMRLSPHTGKVNCRIIDFVDSLNRVGAAVSAPSLLGLNVDEFIDDAGNRDIGSSKDEANSPTQSGGESQASQLEVPHPRALEYIDCDDPFSMVDDIPGTRHIKELSPNAWVCCGNNKYVLDCLGRGFIKIQPRSSLMDSVQDTIFQGTFTPVANQSEGATTPIGSPFLRKRVILSANTLDQAVRACDSYAAGWIFKNQTSGLSRYAKWRQQPATDKQKAFVYEKFVHRGRHLDAILQVGQETNLHLHPKHLTKKVDVASLNKGQAANIIVRLKHGAQKHHTNSVKAAVSSLNQEERSKRKLEGEVVRVGPLL